MSQPTGKSEPELRERKKVYKVRPYHYRLHLFVSNDVLRSFKRRNLPSKLTPNGYAFIWSRDGCNDVFAFLPEKCGLGSIAHEMFHVIHFIMKSVGITLTDESEEAYTYLLDELTQMAAEFVHADDSNKYRKEEENGSKRTNA